MIDCCFLYQSCYSLASHLRLTDLVVVNLHHIPSISYEIIQKTLAKLAYFVERG